MQWKVVVADVITMDGDYRHRRNDVDINERRYSIRFRLDVVLSLILRLLCEYAL
jgi:hypothetical protein